MYMNVNKENSRSKKLSMPYLRIKTVGNLLPHGHFILHSAFENVLNYVNSKNQLLTVAINDKYLSPNIIIILGRNLSIIKTMEFIIDEESVVIKDKGRFYIKYINIYDSFFDFKLTKNIDLKTKISKFEDAYLPRFNPKSLRFLIDKKYEQDLVTSYEKAYVKYVKLVFYELKNGNFYEGISKMKGAGFGLTPSGDDFIAGMLYAFDVLKNVSKEKNNVDVEKIRKIAKGKNPISNSLIYYASKGAYYKRFKDFLEAILYNEENLEKAFNNLIEIGETSSSDMLTGFLTTIHNTLCTD